MDPFLGGLGPKNETQPGIIRNTLGSSLQPSFWVAVWAEQRFSGRYRMRGVSDDDPPLPLRSHDSDGVKPQENLSTALI